MNRLLWALGVVFALSSFACQGTDGNADGDGYRDGDGSADTDAGLDGDSEMSRACSAETCEGCCDGDLCRTGDDDGACGRGGVVCSDCATTGDVCLERTCSEPCGNGAINLGEECDGDDFGGQTCVKLGAASGTLTCTEDCKVDRSGCLPLSCKIAASDPNTYPCEFCSEDGTTVIRCGFCHPFSPPDDAQSCEAGTRCYSWYDPEVGETQTNCLDAPPEYCDADFDDVCDGDVVVRCDGGRLMREDCGSFGMRCETIVNVGDPGLGCVELEAEPCTPDGYDESCDNDVPVICSIYSSYESHEPCDEGVCVDVGANTACLPSGWVECDPTAFVERCEGDAIITCVKIEDSSTSMEVANTCSQDKTCAVTAIGPTCVEDGTVACDFSTYTPHCDGDRVFRCSPTWAWEYFDDCSTHGEGLLTCATFGNSPACAPSNYTACDEILSSACVGDVIQECRSPGWLGELPCEEPSPICVAATNHATCTFEGAATCTPSSVGCLDVEDRYGELRPCAKALRCEGSSTIVLCDAELGIEIKATCPNSNCVDDPDWTDDYLAYCYLR
jgi:hypothetical protein